MRNSGGGVNAGGSLQLTGSPKGNGGRGWKVNHIVSAVEHIPAVGVVNE